MKQLQFIVFPRVGINLATMSNTLIEQSEYNSIEAHDSGMHTVN